MDHCHAWVALTGTAGDDTEIVVRRGKQRLTLHYALPNGTAAATSRRSCFR
jgi:20S proteasome alpha/beta subunit